MTKTTIHKIRQLQQQGQLTAALQNAQQLQAADPDASAVQALTAVLLCQRQQTEDAQHLLTRLDAKGQIFESDTATDIAGAYLLLDNPAAALQQLDSALKQQPDHPLANTRKALLLMRIGRFKQAAEILHAGLDNLPTSLHPALSINLALCYNHLHMPSEALVWLKQAEQSGACNRLQWLLAAIDCYISLDEWQQAEQAIELSLTAGIEREKAALLHAVLFSAQDRHDDACRVLREAIKASPENIDLLAQLSEIRAQYNAFGEAAQLLRKAISLQPESSKLWASLAQLTARRWPEEARKAADKALSLTESSLGQERATALSTAAGIHAEAGEYETAQTLYLEALDQLEGCPAARLGLGHLYMQWGKVDLAIEQFEAVGNRSPIASQSALISARHFPEDDNVLHQIEKVAHKPGIAGSVQSGLLFDLAAAWAGKKHYDRAFHFANEANHAVSKRLSYDSTKHQQRSRQLTLNFDREFFASRQHFGLPSQRPVFVLGMPRSGTTLVEQILGSHSQIYGAGEIAIMSDTILRLDGWEQHIGSGIRWPDCIQHMSVKHSWQFAQQVLDDLDGYNTSCKHVIDKLPHNFENIGLIRLLFPNAPIIHVSREPKDIAISNYFTDYYARFGGMGFAYSLEDIGHQLVDHHNLMNHWHSTVEKPILTVRYEDVVDSPAHEAKRMLEYIGVDWEDNVLQHQNLDRAVKTASVWQVRQPIYKTSKEKWRRYEKHLAPLEAVIHTPQPFKAITEEECQQRRNLPAPGLFFDGMNMLQSNQPRHAATIFRKLLKYNPGHAAATHMLGIALAQQKNFNEALKLLRASLQIQPDHASWHQNLSDVLNAAGYEAQAKAAAQQAKQLLHKQSAPNDSWLYG